MRFAAHRLLRRLGVTAAVLAMVQPIAPTQAAGSAFSRVAEQQLDALWRLPQWQQVMRQLPQQENQVRACLSRRVCSDPGVLWLAQIIERSHGRSPIQQAAEVNSALNRKPYRTDQEQFGREDVWESPVTFAHLGGDCEDYAIAKYFVLKLLGFKDGNLRIVVLTSDGGQEVHALLLVRAEQSWLILDNRTDRLQDLGEFSGWRPQYAVNETGGFRYLSAGASGTSYPPAQR